MFRHGPLPSSVFNRNGFTLPVQVSPPHLWEAILNREFGSRLAARVVLFSAHADAWAAGYGGPSACDVGTLRGFRNASERFVRDAMRGSDGIQKDMNTPDICPEFPSIGWKVRMEGSQNISLSSRQRRESGQEILICARQNRRSESRAQSAPNRPAHIGKPLPFHELGRYSRGPLGRGSAPLQRYDRHREVVEGPACHGTIRRLAPIERRVSLLHDVPARLSPISAGFPWPDNASARSVLW